MAWGQAFSVSSKTRMLHKASGCQVQRRWFFVECVTDLQKLLLKGVVDARTLFVLNEKLKKYPEQNLIMEKLYVCQKIPKSHCRQRANREESIMYANLVLSLPSFLATLRVQVLGSGTFDLTQYRCSC